MPMRCPPVQLLWGFPECEVFVVCLDDEGGLGPDQVWSPVFKCLYYGQEFSFVDVISLFG